MRNRTDYHIFCKAYSCRLVFHISRHFIRRLLSWKGGNLNVYWAWGTNFGRIIHPLMNKHYAMTVRYSTYKLKSEWTSFFSGTYRKKNIDRPIFGVNFSYLDFLYCSEVCCIIAPLLPKAVTKSYNILTEASLFWFISHWGGECVFWNDLFLWFMVSFVIFITVMTGKKHSNDPRLLQWVYKIHLIKLDIFAYQLPTTYTQ